MTGITTVVGVGSETERALVEATAPVVDATRTLDAAGDAAPGGIGRTIADEPACTTGSFAAIFAKFLSSRRISSRVDMNSSLFVPEPNVA